MARHLRRRFEGAKYHVTNRGNGRQAVFSGPDDYRRFLAQLKEAMDKDGVRLYAYCLMPNHFHLFVDTPRGNLDRFMGRLTTAYAMYWRRRHNRPGHCFQSRYHAPLVEGEDYALRLTRYIHLNPVKVKAAGELSVSERWKRVREYPWSSIRGYLQEKATEEGVDYRWLDVLDGRSRAVARGKYGQYLMGCLDEDDEEMLKALWASVYAVGDEEFRKEQESWAIQEARRRRKSVDLELPERKATPLEDIERLVAKEFGVTVERLSQKGARTGWGRAVLVELCCSAGGLTQRAMAGRLGGVSEHAVCKLRQRLRERLTKDASLGRTVRRLQGVLSIV